MFVSGWCQTCDKLIVLLLRCSCAVLRKANNVIMSHYVLSARELDFRLTTLTLLTHPPSLP